MITTKKLCEMPVENVWGLLLSGEIDYHWQDNGFNLLHWATLTACSFETLPFDQRQRISWLMAQDVDINQSDRHSIYHNTPLHILIANETTDVAFFYIDEAIRQKKALNLKLTDSEGKTPFLLAIKMRQCALALHMIENKDQITLDVNLADHLGMTPLHYACAYGSVALIQALIDAGANPSARNRAEQTPLDLSQADERTLRAFFKSVSMDCDRDERATFDVIRDSNSSRIISSQLGMLTIRAVLDNKDNVKEQLRQGILDTRGLLMHPIQTSLPLLSDTRALDYIHQQVDHLSGRSVLAACIASQPSARKQLIALTMDLKVEILKASITPDVQKMRDLFDNPKAVQYMNEPATYTGRTALHNAVFHGNLAMCEYLLNAGASLYVQDKSGNTPLHLAVLHNKTDIALLLRSKQDDFTQRNTQQVSVLDLLNNEKYSALNAMLFPRRMALRVTPENTGPRAELSHYKTVAPVTTSKASFFSSSSFKAISTGVAAAVITAAIISMTNG